MEDTLGLLKVRVLKGINLAIRDARSSDPYIVLTLGHQKLKTHVEYNTVNPVWNDELSFLISEPNDPISLTVFDKDTFSVDDKMGNAEIDIKPYLTALSMGLQKLPNGCALKKVHPSRKNCLADESSIVWNNGKITQTMCLRLNNVECGEVEVELEWLDVPGSKGLGHLESSSETV